MDADRFFAFARARHDIYLRREQGLPRSEWTSDPILQTYKFTNVYRELDRTTLALRQMTDNLVGMNEPLQILFTVAMRWFNRIETWRKMQEMAASTQDLARRLAVTDSRAVLRAALASSPPPYVTGAYIVKTPDGMNKLDGVFQCIEWLADKKAMFPGMGMLSYAQLERHCLDRGGRVALADVHSWLLQHSYMGGFMAYEVVTDLRWMEPCREATDVATWAHAGPGAMRGLNRICGRELGYSRNSHPWCDEMRQLLSKSVAQIPLGWPRWEMREVEHTLCEFDKYERVRLGQGAPRSKFVPTV